MFPKLLLSILLSGYYINCIEAWRPFTFVFVAIEVYMNPEIGRGSGLIKNNSAGHTVIDIEFEFKENYKHPIMANMVVMSVILSGHRPWYHNCTSNLCEVFKNPNSVSPVVKGLYKGVVAQLDMPLGCPIPKGVYHIRGAGAVEDYFPPYIPLNTYKIILRFFSQIKPKQMLSMGIVTIKVKAISNKIKKTNQLSKAK